MPFKRNDNLQNVWSTLNKTSGYRLDNDQPSARKSSQIYPDEPAVDPHIESQLIDQAISLIINQHPEITKNKTIRRHQLQMIIGKITSGQVDNLITLKNMIKTLKKRGIKTEGSTMKIKRSDIANIIKEVLNEAPVGNKDYKQEDMADEDFPAINKKLKSMAIDLEKILKDMETYRNKNFMKKTSSESSKRRTKINNIKDVLSKIKSILSN